MAFSWKDRQKIIDDYLSQSGQNMFVPVEFVDWLADKPDHDAYELFYGMTDEAAALQHRVALARRMASGLRIVARQDETKSNVVSVSVKEYPAFVSPMAGRKNGGGYYAMDPEDAAHMVELLAQGQTSLRSWLHRYRGVFEAAGHDLSAIEEIAASDDDSVAQSA